MNEYMWGYGQGELSKTRGEKIDRIARKHGAAFTNPCMPGRGHVYWFAGPNRGEPFDRELSAAVEADLRRAGFDPTNLAGTKKR